MKVYLLECKTSPIHESYIIEVDDEEKYRDLFYLRSDGTWHSSNWVKDTRTPLKNALGVFDLSKSYDSVEELMKDNFERFL